MKMIPAIEKWEQHLSKTRAFSTKSTNVNSAYLFAIFMRNPHIESVREEDVMEWLDLLEQTGKQAQGNRTKMSSLRQLFNFYQIRGYEVINPLVIGIPRRAYPKARVMDEETHQKLLSISGDRERMILRLMKDTGARVNELVSLDVGTVDTFRMQALILTEKTRRRRPYATIKWTHETNEYLREFIAGRSLDEPLFVHIRAPHDRLLAQGVRIQLKRYCLELGLPHIANPHSYRHWLAHRMVLNGATLIEIATVLRHRDLTYTQSYLDMNGIEMTQIYRKRVELVV